MSQPFVGEIRIFAGNFAPVGWAFCNGAQLAISENETLFQLIGTTYGGDGESTFNLPDLRGRFPLHQQQNAFTIGELAGTEEVTLTTQQIPVHSHTFIATTGLAIAPTPSNNVPAQSGTVQLYIEDVTNVSMAPQAITPVGGSQPHDNMHPYLVLNFIISLFGEFPSPT